MDKDKLWKLIAELVDSHHEMNSRLYSFELAREEGKESELYRGFLNRHDRIKERAAEIMEAMREEPLPPPPDKVQFLVMFKNKALMCITVEKESALNAGEQWNLYKTGKGEDGVVTLGHEESDEIMMFTLSDVCCIKVILSQKDVGVTG